MFMFARLTCLRWNDFRICRWQLLESASV